MQKLITRYNLAESTAQEVFDSLTTMLFTLGPSAKLKLTDNSCVVVRALFGNTYKEQYNGLSWHYLVEAGLVCNRFAALVRAITNSYNSAVTLSVEGQDFDRCLKISLRSVAFRFGIEHKLTLRPR